MYIFEQDSGHDMGFGFEGLISKIMWQKLFFNTLLLILVFIVAYIVKAFF